MTQRDAAAYMRKSERALDEARLLVREGKPKLTPHQMKEAIKRRDAGEAVREIVRSYKVHHSTISRLST